jgi:hypothetical protein
MKHATLFYIASASIALANDQFFDRRADNACSPGNNCQRGVGGTNGKPALASRLNDCQSLYTVTVIPATR